MAIQEDVARLNRLAERYAIVSKKNGGLTREADQAFNTLYNATEQVAKGYTDDPQTRQALTQDLFTLADTGKLTEKSLINKALDRTVGPADAPFGTRPEGMSNRNSTMTGDS